MNYPQGIAGYAVVGTYIGDDAATPWVGPVKPTRKEASEAYYLRACEYAGVDPDTFPVGSAWHEELIDAKCALEVDDNVIFDSGDEHLFMVEVPL